MQDTTIETVPEEYTTPLPNKSEVIRWTISSLNTFLATAIPTLLISLDSTFETHEAITGSVLMGLVFTACRAGLKALIESLAKKYK